jgi:hypothetical protein
MAKTSKSAVTPTTDTLLADAVRALREAQTYRLLEDADRALREARAALWQLLPREGADKDTLALIDKLTLIIRRGPGLDCVKLSTETVKEHRARLTRDLVACNEFETVEEAAKLAAAIPLDLPRFFEEHDAAGAMAAVEPSGQKH